MGLRRGVDEGLCRVAGGFGFPVRGEGLFGGDDDFSVGCEVYFDDGGFFAER